MPNGLTTLEGKEAIELWRAGKDEWNAWVKDEPGAAVSFQGVGLGNHTSGAVDFLEYEFPNGGVDFSYARFGDGGVDFRGVRFGKGKANFSEAQFGDGEVNFSYAQFGDGEANFYKTQFGDGEANFYKTQFGDGGANFSEARFGDGGANFSEARFGKGKVDFSEAQFGDGDVHFAYARFGDGGVDFSEAQFGDGDVHFFEAQFGDGGVDFSGAQFGKGEVDFLETRFGKGKANFSEAQFGDGGVDFRGARFGDGEVYFVKAQFGDGDVHFYQAQFGDGGVDFSEARLGKGEVYFAKARFGDGTVFFHEMRLGDGGVDFSHARFGANGLDFSMEASGSGVISFSNAQFDGPLQFTCGKPGDDNPQSAWDLLFRLARFESVAVIEGSFNLVDLRSTTTKGHFDLQNLHIQIADQIPEGPDGIASANARIAMLRRLKELAENNRHHEAALRFFAAERRTLRQSGQQGRAARALERLYDWVSDYGRSILRPAMGFLGVALIGALLFMWFSPPATCHNAADALGASVSNMLPFLSSPSGTGACGGMQSVLLQRTHGVLGYILLFLIGLGVRNRFRL